jgi:hypothetical protein
MSLYQGPFLPRRSSYLLLSLFQLKQVVVVEKEEGYLLVALSSARILSPLIKQQQAGKLIRWIKNLNFPSLSLDD